MIFVISLDSDAKLSNNANNNLLSQEKWQTAGQSFEPLFIVQNFAT